MNVFDKLAPYIQEYIYREKWEELREIQVAACNVIFDTDENLLLTSGTASGKTEAAFIPTLTEIYRKPSKSVGILYISPLKALINDQFNRLNGLLREGNVSVYKWHGDASQAEKKKLIQKPNGVLQITPESLESLLINKKDICLKLFSDLRFVIIDEVHYFMDSDRGIQVQCQLERVQKLINKIPRRIGLSATLGDYSSAEQWLNSGTDRKCITPITSECKKKIKICMKYFPVSKQNEKEDKETFYNYLYNNTLNNKSIIFANERSMTEKIIANLRKIAEENHTDDIYRIHHGSISKIIREQVENEMKMSDKDIVTAATVTLELGIDIGALDRIIQIGAPKSTSSFTQRLGRCGRRGQTAELIFTFMEYGEEDKNFKKINWNILKALAIFQVFITEKWVEPIKNNKLPYSMLYHQTMAFLLSNGEVLPSVLAQNILSISAFKDISKEDYKIMIKFLLEKEQISKTERGGLIIGTKGEKIVNNFEFYSVFKNQIEYIVKTENQEIGTVQECFPAGTRFALAGKSWECVNIIKKSRVIFVKEIKGITNINWIINTEEELHSKIVRKMKEILLSNENYNYITGIFAKKIEDMRTDARETKIVTNLVNKVEKNEYEIYPWIGTRQLYALLLALRKFGYQDSNIDRSLIFIKIHTDKDIYNIEHDIKEILKGDMNKYDFELEKNMTINCKYNRFIPDSLLKKQFIEDFVDYKGLLEIL